MRFGGLSPFPRTGSALRAQAKSYHRNYAVPPRNKIVSHRRSNTKPMSTGTSPNPQITPESILQTGLAFWPSKILLSAVEMELFTDLAKGPQSMESIRGRHGLHPRAAHDFL